MHYLLITLFLSSICYASNHEDAANGNRTSKNNEQKHLNVVKKHQQDVSRSDRDAARTNRRDRHARDSWGDRGQHVYLGGND